MTDKQKIARLEEVLESCRSLSWDRAMKIKQLSEENESLQAEVNMLERLLRDNRDE